MKSVRDYLNGARSVDERRDRELLLAHVLRCDRAHLYAHPEAIVETRIDALLDRHGQDEPVAYLTGHREFWSLDLLVDHNVLIPRPETELLVELALARIGTSGRVLDLGTGSGAIALAIASERPDVAVIGCDSSSAALDVARRNGERLGIDVAWLQSDWFGGIDGTFDVVVSNPPYVAARDRHLASLRHEPMSALIAGEDGLTALREVVSGARAHLTNDGWLIAEHGHDQAPAVQALFFSAGLREVGTHCDLAGHARATVGRR